MKNKYNNIIIILLIILLGISVTVNFYFFNGKQMLVHSSSYNKEKEILLREISIDLKNKIKDLEIKQKDLEASIDKITSNVDRYNGVIVKLQNQTKEGEDNNIKIIINLLEIKDYSTLGKNFSDTLGIVENMTKNNNELHAVVLKMYDHKNDSITNSKIIENFSKELKSVENVGKHNKSLKDFIKSNIRLTKTSGNNNLTLLEEKFKELIDKNEYEEAMRLLNSSKTVSNFNDTLELLSKKLELELLLKEAFRIIYNQN